MKRITTIFLITTFLLILTSCSSGSSANYPLNGIWAGVLETEYQRIKISLAFIDDLCFAFNETEFGTDTERMSYTYMNGKGTLSSTNNFEVEFTVEDDSLNYTVDGRNLLLKKDTESDPAPDVIKGVWRDAENIRFLAFVNDKVFMSNGRINTYGIFNFFDNEGFFITVRPQFHAEFVVTGSEMEAVINNSFYKFERKE